MELIKISSTKLKIMLSADDMTELDFDPLSREDISCRAGFRNILIKARDNCGFDAVGERVFVQYYPEKHGGCEMFVTKLAEKSGERGRQMQKKCRKELQPTKAEDTDYIVYAYGALDGVIATCGRMQTARYTGKSALYKVYSRKNEYYLIVDVPLLFAGEDGGREINGKYLFYLCEHGERLLDNAVERLGSLT